MMNPQPGRSIELQTYLKNPISNSIDVDSTAAAVNLARQPFLGLINGHGVRQVGQATGRYNCHGLTFATRRTNIPAAGYEGMGLIDRILADDQYVLVPEANTHEGDLVIWRNGKDVDHTGIIVLIDQAALLRTVFVWSMWGGLGEFVHRVPLTPYRDCAIEYWGLR